MEDITEETSGDGFDQEILADYKSQDYEFVSGMASREISSPVDCLDLLFVDEDETSKNFLYKLHHQKAFFKAAHLKN